MANILERNTNFVGWRIDNLSTEALPVEPNAPVTRAVWTCNNLPVGLTLSTDGKLSGRPTVAGTYTCAVQVATNWGTATKNISIRVTE